MVASSSKLVDNMVGKGEIARYEQFLLFLQCFQKIWCTDTNSGIVWERVKTLRKFVDNQCKEDNNC